MPGVFDVQIAAEFFAQIVARINESAARVFLLAQAKKIRREADLRFDLFLAIAEIVVRDDRHHRARGIAGAQFERLAAIVAFRLGLPAHAVAALAFRGLFEREQTKRLFGQLDQMRREDHATGVAGPMLRIQARVVFRQVGIAAVAENRLHEIEVAHQSARGEKPDLHREFRRKPFNPWQHEGTQKQRNPRLGLRRFAVGERQAQQIGRRRKGLAQQFGERVARHGDLVGGNRQAPFGDVKTPLRGAPVVFGIVQHPLLHAVRADDVRMELIAARGQGKHPRHAGAVE